MNLRVKVYFEGASKGKFSRLSKIEARIAFEKLAEKLKLSSRPSFIPCGSRLSAYEDFCTALQGRKLDEIPLLLVDSEDAVTAKSAWEHLKSRPGDGWEKPQGARDQHVFLMVQCMEAWMIADAACLEKYYHNDDFHKGQIPNRSDIENISKNDIYTALEAATKDCYKKGKYGKGEHSWKIISMIDPLVVENKSPHAKRFFRALRGHCKTIPA